MLGLNDRVQYGTDSFGKEPAYYRVTGFIRRYPDDLTASDETDPFLRELLVEMAEEAVAERKQAGLPHTTRYLFEWCLPEEATHVTLRGIAGATAPIEKCMFVESGDHTEESTTLIWGRAHKQIPTRVEWE